MAVKQNATYNVGSVSKTQDQLNNNMSGTDANAIYYATHGGSGNTNYYSGANSTSNPSNVTFSTPTNTGSSGSGKGSGGSGGSGSSSTTISGYGGGGGYDYASMIASMLEQQRAAAQAAYNASRGRLEEAWGNTQNALRGNLESTLNQLQRQYDYSSQVANDDAAKSLREAYVNYMLNKKNLAQNLSAAGFSGGATESNMANMYNNYGNSRNNINTTLAENIAQLLNSYQNNTASAEQLFNTQYADAMNNYVNNLNGLETALANNLMSSYSGSSLSNLASYASTLGNLVSNMQSVPLTATTNNLAVDTYNTSQANDQGSVTDYAKYLAMMQNLAANGATPTQQVQYLKASGADLNTIKALMS